MSTVSSQLGDLRRQQLAKKWIREHEEYINEHLGDSVVQLEDVNPRGCLANRDRCRLRMPAGGVTRVLRVKPASNDAWLVSLYGDEQGQFGTEHA